MLIVFTHMFLFEFDCAIFFYSYHKYYVLFKFIQSICDKVWGLIQSKCDQVWGLIQSMCDLVSGHIQNKCD